MALQPITERRALLRVGSSGHSYEAIAAGLSVPYASGLKRLLVADPEVEVALVDHAPRGLDQAALDQDVGYLDLRGRGRLIGPGFVYVAPPVLPSLAFVGSDVEREPDTAGHGQARVSPFAPKASRVVRAFLALPGRRWRLSELAEACDMNPGNVHRVLAALVAGDFIERDGDDYVVPDPGSLLEAWADQGGRGRPRARLTIPVHAPLARVVRDVVGILGGDAVVSGELAAELYAPHLPAASAIVHHVGSDTLDEAGLRAAAQPGGLRAASQIVIDQVDSGVAAFSVERDGLPLVSAAQLYFELARVRGRGREAAEHVRREVLSY